MIQKINELYNEYSNDLYKYAFFMINEHEQAKDIVQETFIRAYIKLDSFQGEYVKSWLFRIARNVTIDLIRKNKPIAYFLDLTTPIKSNDKTPEQVLLMNETEQQLYFAMNKLKRSYRDVIILRKIKEFSISETSHILGWSENKVKVTLFRGMQALKKELEKEGVLRETNWGDESIR
ncbi:RNA polymerase sigma-70 factor, ECF subfamily [Bacillus sp. OK048]|nr:RNA polymerase sigma-70 factor, ECF subfamily [Bacillus sp. OK048]